MSAFEHNTTRAGESDLKVDRNPPKQNHKITEVSSSNGRMIAANYLGNPNYDPESNVCACLHWVYLLYCPSRNKARAYLLRDAISLFTDFRYKHNSHNPEPLQIHRYTDINAEIFNRYIDYVRDEGDTLAKPEILKTAITWVGEETGLLPSMTLPIVPVNKKISFSPLSSEALDSLEYALTKHTNTLWEKLAFREKVRDAQPYTAEEVNDILWPESNKTRILQSYHYHLINDKRLNKKKWLRLLSECTDSKLRDFAKSPNTALENLRNFYRQEFYPDLDLHSTADPLAGVPFNQWEVDYARVIKTFLINGYPFEIPLNSLYDEYRPANMLKIEVKCPEVVKTLLYRFTVGNRTNATLPNVDELLGMYFPTLVDMTAVLLFMMLQSGWNKETALAIDKDNFEHLLTGTIEEAVKVVYAEKAKSQSTNKTYHDAKRIEIPSSGDDPYSFYNLIRLAKVLSEPLSQYPFDEIPADLTLDQMNPLFLCIRPRTDWSRGGRLTSIAHPKTFVISAQHFLAQYKVVDNGTRIKLAGQLTRRLRPTWLLHKKRDNPVAVLSMTMGHVSRDTTDIFYDNSPVAHHERLQRLRSELEAVIDLLRARKFKGMLGKHAQALASEMWKVFHIPGQQKPMWACANQKKPDWVGSDIIASTGSKCWSIKECIFCSQLRIFQDSLPFIIERESHLNEFQAQGSLSSRYAKEQEALQFIIDEWGDDEEVRQAARYVRRHGPLLPRDLDILEIIFESEEYNV